MPEKETTPEQKEETPKINIKEQKRLEKMEQHKLELSEKIKECILCGSVIYFR